MTNLIAMCIGCGCTDDSPCIGGCSWLRIDYERGVGVCSGCPEDDAGDVELSDEAHEHVSELEAELAGEEFDPDLDDDAPELLLPGDFDYEETLREMRRR